MQSTTVALLLCCMVAAWHVDARQLHQESPPSCSKVAWDFSKCMSPPAAGTVTKAEGTSLPLRSSSPAPAPEAEAARPGRSSLPPRFSSVANPFLPDPDRQPLVRSAQGYVSGGTIGFRTGGAQDVENFRENVKAGYLPLPTDVTFEGVVKDYYFDTSAPNQQPCKDLFCPAYSAAASGDPLVVSAFSGPPNSSELFLAVGLDSGLQLSEVQRKPLNLVALLDYSGSMGSPFNLYYYDRFGAQQQLKPEEGADKLKIDVAKEVLTGILDQVGPQDRVGISLFSDTACSPLPLTPVPCLDVAAIKAGVDRDVNDTLGTNMSAGYDLATQQLTNCGECMRAALPNAENRIIMITDAMPNEGDWSDEGLLQRLSSNADKNIFTTIVGVGLDFNTELVEAISKVKGAQYYSVHTPGEFQRRLVQDFNFSVNPLVFDLELGVAPASLTTAAGDKGWRILQVYGSPNPNLTAKAALSSNGTVSRISTLFPSPKSEEGIKGGVVLLRMGTPSAGAGAAPLELQVKYTDRAGKTFASGRSVKLPAQAVQGAGQPYWQSTGVRKAVLLARYTDLVRSWLMDEWPQLNVTGNRTIVIPADLCAIFPEEYCLPVVSADVAYGVQPAGPGKKGCQLQRWATPDACILPTPHLVIIQLNQWERQSQNLTGHVDPPAKQAFREFLPYMQSEIAALGDPALSQEVDILEKILAS